MGEWRESSLGYRLYKDDLIVAEVACTGVFAGRAWYWYGEHFQKYNMRAHYFPDVASAKRWCERELAFAGLEAIA